MHDVAVVVGEYLQLDVARIDDTLFHEDVGAAEGLGGFGYHAIVIAAQVDLVLAAADAATAAAGCRFQHHGITELTRVIRRRVDAGDTAVAAGRHRYAGFDHRLAGFDFIAHLADDGSVGADEADTAAGADLGQHRIFGEKAIAGVERVAAGGDRQIDDAVGIEITGHRVGADIIGFVGLFEMQAVAVGVGVDRDRGDAHLGAGAHDAHRDLAAVGEEDYSDHARTSSAAG